MYADAERRVTNEAGGTKNDSGKVLESLLHIGCPNALHEASCIMTMGASKYGKHNWKQVESERYWDAFYRHLQQHHADPQRKDSDSDRSHLSHALTNLLFIIELEKHYVCN